MPTGLLSRVGAHTVPGACRGRPLLDRSVKGTS